MANRKTYVLISGEGTGPGTAEIKRATPVGIKRILARKRSGGDRWARAACGVFETRDGGWAGYNAETGELMTTPDPATL